MQKCIKKILRSGNPSSSHNNTVLIISNDEMEDIIKIVKSLEDSGLLPKGVSETVQIEAKEQKRGFLSMLLGALGVSLFGNILTGQAAIAKKQCQGTNRAGGAIVRVGYGLCSSKNIKMTF